jgi:hypothetical protein
MLRGIFTKYAHIAGLLVVLGFSANVSLGQGDRIYICHFNHSEGYVLIEVPPQAMSGHFDASGNPLHYGDYISQTPSCGNATPSPTGTPGGGDPDPVPEPMTMLLFGAGVAGVGYAVRKLRRKGDEPGDQE